MLDAPSTTLASRLSGAAAQAAEGDGAARKPSAPRRPSTRAKKSAAVTDTPYIGASRLPGAGGQRDFVSRREPGGVRIRVNGSLPRSLAGRITAAVVCVGAIAGIGGSLYGTRRMLLHDPRLTIPSSDHIAITGISHLTKPQLLSIFGEDVDQNILTIPLPDRQAALESLPWVEHATVMRLLPNRLEVKIVERTPVAFVREGGQIGLIDGHGVLLDMTHDAQSILPSAHYSFPVVTGVHAADPADQREARMKLFVWFIESLDAESKDSAKVSKSLSEVDMSSPEDIRALLPAGGSDILVHFGDDDFLARYKRFESHLPEWKQKFPKLASVDMRYERDVVLEMQPNTPVPETASPAVSAGSAAGKRPEVKPAALKPVPTKADAALKPATHHSEVALSVLTRSKPALARPLAKKPEAAKAKPLLKPAAKLKHPGVHP